MSSADFQVKKNLQVLGTGVNNINGTLNLQKDTGKGIQIENAYGWRNLIGDITPRQSGTEAPTLATLVASGSNLLKAYTYQAADKGDCIFHIPHDYAPGTDIFIHSHWTHNGTNISGALQIDFIATFAKGHQQASFHTPKVCPLNVTGLNITNCPTLMHRVDEVQLSTAGGSSSMLDTSLIEVDGLILVTFVVNTIPSISGSSYSNRPYLLTVDLHYQSTGIPTKNKSPSFYA